MPDVQNLVKKLEKADARRQEVRARIVCDDLEAPERGSLDAELMGLNHTIEHYAKLINQSVAEAAKRGQSPGRVHVGQVVDTELKAFLDQVKHTCDKLISLNGKAPKLGSPEALAVARDQQKAKQLERETQARVKDCDKEQKKTEKARGDVDKERARLERERQKVEDQRARTRTNDEKLEHDLEEVARRRGQAEKARDAADREKRALATQLKASRDARRRGQLEQRIQKLNLQLADAKRRIEHEGKHRSRLETLRASVKRELEQLDQATKRLDDEVARLGKEDEKLEERVEQLGEQREVQQGRLKELAKAELTLKKAARH